MNLKKLLDFKCKLVPKQHSSSKNFEFDATLENHAVGNQDIYRLRYIEYHRIGELYRVVQNNIGLVDWPSTPFMFPRNMSREDGFVVLSYLTNMIEKSNNVEPCSLKSVLLLEDVLHSLKEYGFTFVDEKDENNILDLFTVSGRVLLFKKSALYLKYFEWYKENISTIEIQRIFSENQIDLENIKLPKENNEEKILHLTK